MPFITDETWQPATYRLALRAWSMNAPANDGALKKRKAKAPNKPKHADLSRKLRSLMAWRSMAAGSDWTLMPDNDNDETGRKRQMNADCITEIRPLPSEIMRAVRDADVEITERREAKLGGGGDIVRVVSGPDVQRGQTLRQGKNKPDCITSIGRLQFSNGGNTERALILDETGKPKMGDVRIPLGGLIKVGPHRLRDTFRRPKGAPPAANDNRETVRPSLTATEHAIDFVDPLSDAQERDRVRKAVGAQQAAILDHALVAANFTEIGERLGYEGKTAERHGQRALIAACAILEKELAA